MASEKKYVIQNIVFPSDPRHMMCKGLFYHGENGYLDREKGSFTLGMGQKLDLVTYLNSCSWAKWKRYTKAQRLSLSLEIEGSYELRYVGESLEYRQLVRKEFGIIKKENASRQMVSFDFDDNNETIVGVEITAIDKCVVYGGFYEAECYGDAKDVNISLATTTCGKEDFIKKNIRLIKDKILNGNDEMKNHLTVHVVDNGRTLKDEEIVGEHVFLHPNPNTGGSGGYARGMIETLHQRTPATHILLMDDDVMVIPESILRTYHILQLLKPEYEEHFVSGAMLRYEKPNVQHEDVGTIAPWGSYDPLKPTFDQNKISSVVKNEESYYSASNMFAAWWYCCIPMTVVKSNGLPLPLFVRADDAEYSLRCNAKFISMNGICVWHMGFGHKYSAAMDLYQVARNFHIIKAASGILQDVDIHGFYKKQIMKMIKKFEYDEIEMILKAIEDYLKGPSFLEEADGEAILKSNSELNCNLMPLSDHPEIKIKKIEDCKKDDPRKVFDKLYWHLTQNGNRFTPDFMYKKDNLIPTGTYGFDVQAQKLSRHRSYAAVNMFDETFVFRNVDKKRYRELMNRYRMVEREYKRKHEEVEIAYREAQPYLVSEKFWKKYLKME